MRFLMNRVLRREAYRSANPDWLGDHEHCIFCGAKFSERDEDLREGFVTDDDLYWICENCFKENKDKYGLNERWE